MKGKNTYLTDDGPFSDIPKEVIQYMLSFLKSNSSISLVSKRFKEANQELLSFPLLKLMQGKFHKIEITRFTGNGPKRLGYEWMKDGYEACFYYGGVEESDIQRFFNLISKKLGDERLGKKAIIFKDEELPLFDIWNFPRIPHITSHVNLRTIQEGKLQTFLEYIAELKVKSNNCEIVVDLESRAIEKAIELKNTCSVM